MSESNNNNNSYSYPLTNITNPGQNDIICGRGGGTNSHPGNIKFRRLIATHKLRYLAATKVDKPNVARDVVKEWRALNPPGRFLAKINPKDKSSSAPYNDVGNKKAREKASQCLRERNGAANEAVAALVKTVTATGEACPEDYETLMTKAAAVKAHNEFTIKQRQNEMEMAKLNDHDQVAAYNKIIISQQQQIEDHQMAKLNDVVAYKLQQQQQQQQHGNNSREEPTMISRRIGNNRMSQQQIETGIAKLLNQQSQRNNVLMGEMEKVIQGSKKQQHSPVAMAPVVHQHSLPLAAAVAAANEGGGEDVLDNYLSSHSSNYSTKTSTSYYGGGGRTRMGGGLSGAANDRWGPSNEGEAKAMVEAEMKRNAIVEAEMKRLSRQQRQRQQSGEDFNPRTGGIGMGMLRRQQSGDEQMGGGDLLLFEAAKVKAEMKRLAAQQQQQQQSGDDMHRRMMRGADDDFNNNPRTGMGMMMNAYMKNMQNTLGGSSGGAPLTSSQQEQQDFSLMEMYDEMLRRSKLRGSLSDPNLLLHEMEGRMGEAVAATKQHGGRRMGSNNNSFSNSLSSSLPRNHSGNDLMELYNQIGMYKQMTTTHHGGGSSGGGGGRLSTYNEGHHHADEGRSPSYGPSYRWHRHTDGDLEATLALLAGANDKNNTNNNNNTSSIMERRIRQGGGRDVAMDALPGGLLSANKRPASSLAATSQGGTNNNNELSKAEQERMHCLNLQQQFLRQSGVSKWYVSGNVVHSRKELKHILQSGGCARHNGEQQMSLSVESGDDDIPSSSAAAKNRTASSSTTADYNDTTSQAEDVNIQVPTFKPETSKLVGKTNDTEEERQSNIKKRKRSGSTSSFGALLSACEDGLNELDEVKKSKVGDDGDDDR